jgi:hypothetical protein
MSRAVQRVVKKRQETHDLAVDDVGRLSDDLVDRLLLEVRQERKPTRAAGRITHDGAVVDETELGEIGLERLWEIRRPGAQAEHDAKGEKRSRARGGTERREE